MEEAEASHLCCRRGVDRAVGRVVLGAGHRGAHHADYRGVDRAGHRVHHVGHHDLGLGCRVGNLADCHGVDCRAGHRGVGLEDLGDRGRGDFVGVVEVSTARDAAVGLRSLRPPSFRPGLLHR